MSLVGVLDGIGDEVGDDLLDASAVDIGLQAFVGVDLLELDARLLDTLGQRDAGGGELLREVYLTDDNLHGVGIDVGEHQDVVDESQQHVAVVVDEAYHLALVVRRVYHGQQVGEADDGIERRAYLVGHVGQEYGLQTAGVVGALCLAAQLVLLHHDVRDVAEYTEAAGQVALLVVFRDAVELDPLQFGALVGDDGVDLSYKRHRLADGFGWVLQTAHKLVLLIDEDGLQLLQR